MTKSTGKHTVRRAMTIGLVVAAGLGAAGCSSSKDYSGSAKKYIEGDLAKQIGLGDLKASCDDVPKDAKDGDTFNCTADTTDGETIELTATLAGSKVNVETTNLISAAGMTTIENAAVSNFEKQTGNTLGEGAIDCGDGPRVFDPSTDKLDCVLTNPADGQQYDTTITLDSLAADANISIDVSSTPKG